MTAVGLLVRYRLNPSQDGPGVDNYYYFFFFFFVIAAVSWSQVGYMTAGGVQC